MRIRFGPFVLDLDTRQLTEEDREIHLSPKAFELLLALLDRPGELVSRDALRQRLWPGDVFVAFDNNLNNTMSRLRQALNDLGLAPLGLPFPIVGTRVDSLLLARRWRNGLAARGVQALVQLPRCQPGALLSAVVRADHSQADLDRLVRGLAQVTRDRRAA